MSQLAAAPPPPVLPLVRHVSKTTIKPQSILQESLNPCYLSPWDLAMLSVHHIQKGLLFTTSTTPLSESILDELKDSLSRTLTHFFPLAGRLVTTKQDDPHRFYHVFIDCSSTEAKNSGAEFIHAIADHVKISDLRISSSNEDVHPIFESFFPLLASSLAVNHDGHSLPLLAVQVTELVDGVFIGVSFNHVVGDGSSFWHFFNTWSHISRSRSTDSISPVDLHLPTIKPITKRIFTDTIINLPFSHHDEFIDRFSPPVPLREKIFHFSAPSLAKLKALAKAECNNGSNDKEITISSFQALSALIWRAITRARHVPPDEKTTCKLAFNNRSRMDPPLPSSYFGNCINAVSSSATAGDLTHGGLGWAAGLLHTAVVGHKDGAVRAWVEEWTAAPMVYQLGGLFGGLTVMMGSSPRFDMYDGNDFGYWGRAVAVRSGYGNKFDGKVTAYPGRDGGGSVDLEVCLIGEYMREFETDEELLGVVSHP